MSLREEKFLALTAVDYDNVSIDGLKKTFKKILNNKVHGLCFSPYMDGQEPGQVLSEEQIRRRIEII